MTQSPVQRVISVHVREHESSSVFSNTPSELAFKFDPCVYSIQSKNQKPLRIWKLNLLPYLKKGGSVRPGK